MGDFTWQQGLIGIAVLTAGVVFVVRSWTPTVAEPSADALARVPATLAVAPRSGTVSIRSEPLDPVIAGALDRAVVKAGGKPLWGPAAPPLPDAVVAAAFALLDSDPGAKGWVVAIEGVVLTASPAEPGGRGERVELDHDGDGRWDERWDVREGRTRRQVRWPGVERRSVFWWRQGQWQRRR